MQGDWYKAASEVIQYLPVAEWIEEAAPTIAFSASGRRGAMHGMSWEGRDGILRKLNCREGEELPVGIVEGVDVYRFDLEVMSRGMTAGYGSPLDHPEAIKDRLTEWLRNVEMHLWEQLGEHDKAALISFGPPRFIEADGLIFRDWTRDKFYASLVWYGKLVPFNHGPYGSEPILASEYRPDELGMIGGHEAQVDIDEVTGTVVIRDDEVEVAGLVSEMTDVKRRFVEAHR